jgi:hypothetical protein
MTDPADPSPPPRSLELGYRSEYGAPPPRRIRLAVPGWAGVPVQRRDGSAAQPWHCQPFAEGAAYGAELLYPYPHECRVIGAAEGVRFEGDFSPMIEAGLPHPFGVFAAGHYGMATALDLLPPPGYALRLGPHPRYFTDLSGDVPLAVPGHLQRFWPRQFFAVFRAPPPGATHVFRPGEPYAQLLVVPAEQEYAVAAMAPEQAVERAAQDRRVTLLGYFLAKRLWRSDRGHWFDDRYKQLLRIFRRGGTDGVREHLRAVEERTTPKPPS